MTLRSSTLDGALLWLALALLALGPLGHVPGLRIGVVSAMLFWLCWRTWQARQAPADAIPVWRPMLAWGALALLSLSWSVAPALSGEHWWQDILMPFVAGAASYRLASARGTRPALLLAVGTSVLLVFILSLFPAEQLLLLDGDRPGLAYYYPGQGEASNLAVYTLPFWLLLALGGGPLRRLGWLGWLCLPLTLYIGFASTNRMFWLAVIAGIAVFVLLYRPPKARTLLALAAGIVVLMALAYVPFVERMTALYQDARANPLAATVHKDLRPAAWRFWIAEAGQHMPLGKGFGRYTPGADIPPARIPGLAVADMQASSSLAHSHHWLLNVALQLGLPGLLVSLWLAGALLRQMWRALALPQTRSAGAAGLALLTIVFMKNSTDDFLTGGPAVLLWCYFGILLALCRPTDAPGTHAPRS
ncbi:O-antigen ligase family protein [Chitiniphilus purpureus]|uniref:O-antigen ligase family protein n=1 Tax=Chitiniphilus purpureus TaxID=2981137 RepID=A0ABY6DUL7_9NEIS|nr:O-antigen ligase family protein [Chitiniphilus sp. CD1]UXY15568.1 O-antigen ligase family protein [Chitiniphilus sp. CD1]